MKSYAYVILLLVTVLVCPSIAYAYIDPGAGSMLLQLLLGGLAGVFVFLRLFKQRFLTFFGFRKDAEKK